MFSDCLRSRFRRREANNWSRLQEPDRSVHYYPPLKHRDTESTESLGKHASYYEVGYASIGLR